MTVDRREFLHSLVGLSAAWAVSDWRAVDVARGEAASAVTQTPRPAFKVLSADEGAALAAIAARIMPTTDTPGATEAGVVYFMDAAFGSFHKDALADGRKGLADLERRVATAHPGKKGFATLTPVQQDALLRDIESTPFFHGVKFQTMMGMFSEPSYGGNRNEVGWKLLGFNPHGPHKPPFGYYDADAHQNDTR